MSTTLQRLKSEKQTIEENKMNTESEVKAKAAKKELSKEEKKALRRANMSEHGRLHLADEYKEEGYRYRVCNVLPGNIENWKSRGYEVVTHKLKSGDGSSSRPEVDGTPMEFEVGGARGSMKAVWMRITEEDAQILDEIRDDEAREQDSQIHKNPGIPEDQLIGKVSKEHLK